MITPKIANLGYSNLWVDMSTILGYASNFDQQIQKLFANNEQGFFYDPNDLSTMFQDEAGSVPVTAAGQPVGLVLDKSKGLVLGGEHTVDGGFDDPTKWITPSGFSISSGNFVADGTATGSGYQSVGTLDTTSHYVIEFDVVSVSGNCAFFLGSGATVTVYSVGHKKLIMRKGVNSNVGFNVPILGASITVDNLSVKKLAGNHAFQTASASRPILRKNAVTGANYLAFDGADDFLQTSNIDFTGTDKVSLFAGVTKLADSTQIITELSPNTSANAGSFYLVVGTDLGGSGYTSLARGSANAGTTAAARNFTYLAPDVAVLSIKHDISGDLSSMRRNGVIGIGGLADKGEGNFGNYPLFIGRRGGTSLPFTGHIYSLIGVGKLTTDDEAVAIEKELAKQVGVALNV